MEASRTGHGLLQTSEPRQRVTTQEQIRIAREASSTGVSEVLDTGSALESAVRQLGMGKAKLKRRYRNLRALISALDEGVMSRKEVEGALDAVQLGVGLSKRDRALGRALEDTGEDKDSPKYWAGFRAGLVEGYEGARSEIASGVTLRPIADLIVEAEKEASPAKGLGP